MNSSFVVAGVGGCTSHGSFDFRHVELYVLVGHPHRDLRRQFHLLNWSSRGSLDGNADFCVSFCATIKLPGTASLPTTLVCLRPMFPKHAWPSVVLLFFHGHHTKLLFRKAAGTVENPAPEKSPNT